MKCADCKKDFKGIKGLMPREVPGLIAGKKHYDMLCGECHIARQRERDEYERASRGE